MTSTEAPPADVHDAILAVMNDVLAVGKDSRNQQQGFDFRGVDAVINACGPAFRRHSLNVVPMVESVEHENFTTRSGTSMRNTTVIVRFRFFGPGGKEDYRDAVTVGEAADSGDKSVTKAQSVAYRTALIQTLCIPTRQPDPDLDVYERGAPPASSGRDWVSEAGKMQTVEAVQALWRECAGFEELTEEIRSAMTKRAAEIDQQETSTTSDREPVGAPA